MGRGINLRGGPKGPAQLGDFAGRWWLARRIEDRASDRHGTLEGEAVLSWSGEALSYLEEGVLSFPGQPDLTAVRRYIWRIGAAGEVDVRFEDGRAFHKINLARTMPEAVHHCAPDMYDVTYDFSAWPEWSTVWRVQGPRKDYRMVSRYVRVA